MIKNVKNCARTLHNLRNGNTYLIMENCKGGYYCVHQNYNGLFPYGGTFDYNAKHIRDAIRRGILRVSAGILPD